MRNIIFENDASADISENFLNELSSELLATLLLDHTTGKNITWATNDYQELGDGYQYYDEITIPCITGSRGNIIKPRVLKSKDNQSQRSKDMAEVFTPSWVCNAQNNLVDEAWFGRKDVFNTEQQDSHTWHSTAERITDFPEGKSWQDYVQDTRLEITCGEAPYLASRYDTTTGILIPIEQRIGMLDRKLRLVSENTETTTVWLKWAQCAFQNTYGYEWQGDNLLLARETLLITFMEYYYAKFKKMPQQKSINYIAYIVSWNLWQMDGLKCVVPDSCHSERVVEYGLFGDETVTEHHCRGCKTGDIKQHNGVYCIIRDWKERKEKQKIRFVDLIKR